MAHIANIFSDYSVLLQPHHLFTLFSRFLLQSHGVTTWQEAIEVREQCEAIWFYMIVLYCVIVTQGPDNMFISIFVGRLLSSWIPLVFL
jgi:hypothetical protein